MLKRFISMFLMFVICLISAPSVSVAIDREQVGNVLATVFSFYNGDNGNIFTGIDYTPGDIDCNGTVNASDLYHLRIELVGFKQLDNKGRYAADISCDGSVGVIDALVLRCILAEIPVSNEAVVPGGATVTYTNGKYVSIGGNKSGYTFGIKFDGMSFSKRGYIVFDGNISDSSELGIIPLYNNRSAGGSSYYCPVSKAENGYTFTLPKSNTDDITGILVKVKNAATVSLKEIFVCDTRDSAEWICENRIASPAVNNKKLNVRLEGEKTAIRLVGMTDDDRNNTNGGMYHDFVNTKWPSIAVDENDNLYVVGSGNRMAHVDPFGNTLLTISKDGGKSWGKPQNISNTVMDDRDAGILYLGNGEMLVSYFTSDATSYLPGGSNYSSLKPYSAGGSAPNWAAEWDSLNNPKGGIIGNYLDIIKHINNTDPNYNLSASSYVIKSSDYGKSWSTKDYEFVRSGYTAAAGKMLNDYLITKPGSHVPVTNAHGPMLCSDGKIIFAGKVMNPVDQPLDSMAVYISEDGLNYSYLSEIPTPYGYYYNNFHELSVCENADGALVCAIRAQTCNDKVISPETTVYTCFSYDGGLSWTVPEPTGIDGTPPHLLTLDNGYIIMTYSDRTDPRSIRAKVSTDGGRTWSSDGIISENFFSRDDMGYPASAVLSDGTVVSVWYGTYKVSSANEQYSSIISKRWTFELK